MEQQNEVKESLIKVNREEWIARFSITKHDLDVIKKYGKYINPKINEVVDVFFQWLESTPEYSQFFSKKVTLDYVKSQFDTYWHDFFDGKIDEAYISKRKHVGLTHARIGLPLYAYDSAMHKMADLFLFEFYDKASKVKHEEISRSAYKLVHLDTALVTKVFNTRIQETIEEQSKCLMETSIPVTQIWEDILFLPIVGIIDSQRSQDIMNAMLIKIYETHVKTFIIDISGVAVIDVGVADHLMKMNKATQLMGCECVISGVSPEIAQTIVELGIDVTELHTTASMKDALSDSLAKFNLDLKDDKSK